VSSAAVAILVILTVVFVSSIVHIERMGILVWCPIMAIVVISSVVGVLGLSLSSDTWLCPSCIILATISMFPFVIVIVIHFFYAPICTLIVMHSGGSRLAW